MGPDFFYFWKHHLHCHFGIACRMVINCSWILASSWKRQPSSCVFILRKKGSQGPYQASKEGGSPQPYFNLTKFAVCRRIFMANEPVLVTPFFLTFLANLFPQTLHSLPVGVFDDCLTWRNKFLTNNAHIVWKHHQNALELPNLFRLFRAWRGWAFFIQRTAVYFLSCKSKPTIHLLLWP